MAGSASAGEADAASHCHALEISDRLLRPIFERPDEVAMRLPASFCVSLVCSNISDAAEVSDVALNFLQFVVKRP